MLKQIISGGQTGADQAALDVAIKLQIKHGGWIPKGRKTEAGPLPDHYLLKEMETGDYRQRTRQNILDSHGTVIIARGVLTGGSKLTRNYASQIGRPHCFIDLSFMEEFEAAVTLKSFIWENQIEILNVAGPRLSHQPWIYQEVKTVLESALLMIFMDSDQEAKMASHVPRGPFSQQLPAAMEDAVDLISTDLSLKTKNFIARLDPALIHMLYFSFLEYIKERTGLTADNQSLMQSCAKQVDPPETFFTFNDAAMQILKKLKSRLEPDHVLRVVK